MRGEFVGVWEDTYREIWMPLVEHENVPVDVFSQLYAELTSALKEPTRNEAEALALNDTILMRELFTRALALGGNIADLNTAEYAFDHSEVADAKEAMERRRAIESVLSMFVSEAEAPQLLRRALTELAEDPIRRDEAAKRALEATVNDAYLSRRAFERVKAMDLQGERAIVQFLETAYDVLDDLGGNELGNRYFNLLNSFIEKFSLRYDLRRPCLLCPTIPGVFASLIRDLRSLTKQDSHLDMLMRDFESAVRDLRVDCSDGRIKTCIQKQVNLLEALGASYPGVTATELGGMCNQIGTWPHGAIKTSLKNLYGFASDYPGIRHAGNRASALRNVDLRDLLALSILLTGFTPYLSSELDPDSVYRGG